MIVPDWGMSEPTALAPGASVRFVIAPSAVSSVSHVIAIFDPLRRERPNQNVFGENDFTFH